MFAISSNQYSKESNNSGNAAVISAYVLLSFLPRDPPRRRCTEELWKWRLRVRLIGQNTRTLWNLGRVNISVVAHVTRFWPFPRVWHFFGMKTNSPLVELEYSSTEWNCSSQPFIQEFFLGRRLGTPHISGRIDLNHQHFPTPILSETLLLYSFSLFSFFIICFFLYSPRKTLLWYEQ